MGPKLSNTIIVDRLQQIQFIDFSKYGCIQRVANILHISPSAARQFITKYVLTLTPQPITILPEYRHGNINSQFGTCWITNGTNNKKIQRSELSLYENTEWYRGRNIRS